MLLDAIDAARLCLLIASPWLLAPAAVAVLHFEVPPIRVAHLLSWIEQSLPELVALVDPEKTIFEAVVKAEDTGIEFTYSAAPAWAHPMLHIITLLPTAWMVWRLVVTGPMAPPLTCASGFVDSVFPTRPSPHCRWHILVLQSSPSLGLCYVVVRASGALPGGSHGSSTVSPRKIGPMRF